MAQAVKRRYDSTRRQAQAAATRLEILQAARRLFEQQGYAATTMAAIAAEAGVALKTVYVAFETKGGVLRALWNLLLRGDEGDVPIPQRQWYLDVLAEADPERKLRLGAHNSRLVKERICPIFAVIHDAAQVDPAVEELRQRIEREFYDNQKAIVETLQRKRALKRGLDVERATDILWTLNHPDIWQLLVGQRGWSPDDYERWFADTACEQLLKR